MATPTPKPAARRRWWPRPRYSLRTLFILLTAACLICGLRLREAVRQRTAVKQFYQLTANRFAERGDHATTMGYRYQGKDEYYKPIVPKWLHPLRDMIGEEAFGEVTGVQLLSTPTTNDDLRYLADVPTVERVNLDNTNVTEAGLVQLRACPKLRTLGLNGLPITDSGLAELSRHKGLESLSLNGTMITDAGLVHLEKLPKLKGLWLRNTKITDAGYRRLQEALPGCEIQAGLPSYYNKFELQQWPKNW